MRQMIQKPKKNRLKGLLNGGLFFYFQPKKGEETMKHCIFEQNAKEWRSKKKRWCTGRCAMVNMTTCENCCKFRPTFWHKLCLLIKGDW